MMTVHEVSERTGVSIRTLQYYDRIGLLHPKGRTDAGYRLYDDGTLEMLQQILLLRELEFSLNEIRDILGSPIFDRNRALEQQIQMLNMKKEHIERLILLAEKTRKEGNADMGFEEFDTKKMNEYKAKAKASWGDTSAYREFEKKTQERTESESADLAAQLMELFMEFGKIRNGDPASKDAQNLVVKLQSFITEHYYVCTDEILLGLGRMYSEGGEMTANIDRYAGKGTGAFADLAIRIRCAKE